MTKKSVKKKLHNIKYTVLLNNPQSISFEMKKCNKKGKACKLFDGCSDV